MSDHTLGIDIGSTTCKVVLLGPDGALLGHAIEAADPRIEAQAERLVAAVCASAGLSAAPPLGATGYGRKRVPAAKVQTEITCHARGAYFRLGHGGVLIDIGGQDTKVIRIGAGGNVDDFAMNDKCAAGTGRFLEVMLQRLRVGYDEVSSYTRRAERAVPVSSTCTVFAESEIVSLVAQGEPLEGILRGIHQALAGRVIALAGALPAGQPLLLSGGVALNAAMCEALAARAERDLRVVPDPQLVGAIGAALAVRA